MWRPTILRNGLMPLNLPTPGPAQRQLTVRRLTVKEVHLLILKHLLKGQEFHLTHAFRNLLEYSGDGDLQVPSWCSVCCVPENSSTRR